MEYHKQVSKSNYSFESYFFPGRWMSYYHQVYELARRKDINSVLDIGPGTTFLKSVLHIHRPTLTYKSIDVAQDVNPDFIGSVTKLPFSDEQFDVVCAFQVLEHIKFEDFELALEEMNRVSARYVFLSLPHFGPSFELWIKIPFVKRFKFACKIPFPKKHRFNGQHYWEIGKKNYNARSIKRILKKHFILLDEYVPFENQYHHFYILEKSSLK